MTDNKSLIEVSFERTVSKAQYEPERAFVKTSFAADADKSVPGLVDDAFRSLKSSVYGILGLKADTRTKAESVALVAPAQVENPMTKRRGAPTKAEREAKAAATAALATADPLGELEEEEKSETQAISTGDAREDVLGDLGDEKAEVLPVTDNELQTEAGKAVQRLGDAKVIRAMVKNNYRVQSINDVDQSLRHQLVNDLRSVQKDGTIAKGDK